MTRLEFLESTIKYYVENPQRRCNKDGTCFYSPASVGKEGISGGCAIGRFIDPDLALELDAEVKPGFGLGITGVIRRQEYKERLPKWMQKMNIDFLEDVQSLHDDGIYWNDWGLTDAGKRKVDSIKKNYKL
jgi:hypothetical protein